MNAQILQDPLWSSTDVETFDNFLNTNTGQRFLARVSTKVPSAGSSFLGVGQSIHRLGMIAGAALVLGEVLHLRTSEASDATQRTTEEANQSVSQAYPNLDTDEGWSKDLALSTAAQ